MTIDLRDVPLQSGDHVVQFYEREIDLLAVVGQHLARAVLSEETSIVIASETHRQAFETELEFAGIDVVEARRTGQLVMFDAASTMTEFMIEGRIDRNAFRSVFERILGEAFEMGRQVHVYGEMVALLWDAGDVLAAIELESWWNDLVESRPFSLLCAYPNASVAGSQHADALRQICDLHSSVVQNVSSANALRTPSGISERAADFAAEPYAPGAARRFVRDALYEWGHVDDDLVDEAVFVVSELSTNAVVHARSAFSVGIRVLGAQRLVRLWVRDSSPIMSTVSDSSPTGVGWGLRLVADLASSWGVETTTDAKVIWAEFALAPSDKGSVMETSRRVK
jgi:anti-sigma regulatory factor (Ser/Thr protein kinase)